MISTLWNQLLSRPLYNLLIFFAAIAPFHNIAFSIIALTILVKVALFPVTKRTILSQLRMQEIQPELDAIKKDFPDKQEQGVKTMEVYKKYKINPLSGCLPLIIQMPFLIGMFDLLKSAFELRGATFIPGWINDLSAPDVLFSWNYPLPLIGNEFHRDSSRLCIVRTYKGRGGGRSRGIYVDDWNFGVHCKFDCR